MRTTKFWILFFALVLALSATAFFACGGGDDDDDDDDAGGDDDDVSEGEPGTLHGFVRDFQTKTPVQDADVEILNDETGDPFDPPITATSPSNGEVSFDLPDGVDKVGVKVTKSGSTDTVQFHFDSGLQNEEFLLVSNATKDLVALSLGKELDETKSVFAGGIYWGDPVDENPTGCAMVTFDPPLAGAAEVYYFGPDALPTTSRNITGDTPSNGEGTLHATDTKGQAISYYLAINVDVDSDVDLIGTIFENEDDAESDFVRESDVMPQLYPNTVSIANVYFPKADYPSDPTRPWCTQ